MPVTVLPEDITRPAAIDLSNAINDNLIGLITVKNGIVTELVSGIEGVGSPTIINDLNGIGWKGPVTFDLSLLSFDLSLNRMISYQVLGGFNADNGTASDEPFLDFRTVSDKYLKISANGGWDKFYPRVSGAWKSATNVNLTVVDGDLTTIGGTLKRRTANAYDAELYKNNLLTSDGDYAQADSTEDLITLVSGNNDEPIYFIAIYEGARTLAQFDEIDINPNQVFINSANAPVGVNYTIDAVVAEQLEQGQVNNITASFDVDGVIAEQLEDAVNASLSSKSLVTTSPGEQLEQGQVNSINASFSIENIIAEQLEQGQVNNVTASFGVDGVIAEQLEDAVNIALAGALSVTSSPGEQLEQGQVNDITASFGVDGVIAEQLEDAVNIALAGALSVTSSPGEQLEQGQVSDITASFGVDGVIAQQLENAINVNLVDAFTIICSPGEQVEQGQVNDITASFGVDGVIAEQIEDAVNVTLTGSLLVSLAPGEQLEQAKQVTLFAEISTKFLLDEHQLKLIKTTPKFLTIHLSKEYKTIKTTPTFNIKKV